MHHQNVGSSQSTTLDNSHSLHSSLKCYAFNHTGICSKVPCHFLHKCLRCSGNHPAKKCLQSNVHHAISNSVASIFLLGLVDQNLTDHISALLQSDAATDSLQLHASRPLGCTPINIIALCRHLQNYPDRVAAAVLLKGFGEGFRLNYDGLRKATTCNNLVSVCCNEEVAYQLVLKEVQLGRIASPFVNPPLHDLRLSPLGLVPKKDGNLRIIHHLSYPKGSSINDFIDVNSCSVRYSSFDHAVDMITA